MSNEWFSNRAERRWRTREAAATAKVKSKKPARKKPASRAKSASPGTGTRTLVAEQLPRAQLIETGAQFNAEKLTAHINSLIGLVEANNADTSLKMRFADLSLDDTYIDALRLQVVRVDELRTKAGDAADNAMPAALTVRAETEHAADVRNILLLAVAPNPLRDKKLRSGRADTRPGLRIALTNLPKAIPKFARTKLGGPAEMKQAARDALKRMNDAERAYKVALAKTSPAARAAHAAKGVLYGEGKSIADIARRIDPTNSHLYAMTSHLHTPHRSLKRPAKGPTTPPGDPSGGGSKS